MERRPGLVEPGDQLLVGNGRRLGPAEGSRQLGTVGGDPGSIALGHAAELGVHENVGPDVGGLGEFPEHGLQHLRKVRPGRDGLDARACLERVSRVHDDDPVAVAEEGQFPVEGFPPVFGTQGLEEDREKGGEGEGADLHGDWGGVRRRR